MLFLGSMLASAICCIHSRPCASNMLCSTWVLPGYILRQWVTHRYDSTFFAMLYYSGWSFCLYGCWVLEGLLIHIHIYKYTYIFVYIYIYMHKHTSIFIRLQNGYAEMLYVQEYLVCQSYFGRLSFHKEWKCANIYMLICFYIDTYMYTSIYKCAIINVQYICMLSFILCEKVVY